MIRSDSGFNLYSKFEVPPLHLEGGEGVRAQTMAPTS